MSDATRSSIGRRSGGGAALGGAARRMGTETWRTWQSVSLATRWGRSICSHCDEPAASVETMTSS